MSGRFSSKCLGAGRGFFHPRINVDKPSQAFTIPTTSKETTLGRQPRIERTLVTHLIAPSNRDNLRRRSVLLFSSSYFFSAILKVNKTLANN
jgi:hypothetical protein